MYKVLTLNNIAVEGLRHFPRERYEVASEIAHPDAIILRSHNMHDMEIPETLVAVGRAGAGTNNIPIEVMNARGIPVFNAPGANANAVKELAIAGLLIAARNLCDARETVANANVPNMVGQISTCLAQAGLNIEDLLNKSIGELAYTIVDVNGPVTDETMTELTDIDGVLTLRNLGKAVT